MIARTWVSNYWMLSLSDSSILCPLGFGGDEKVFKAHHVAGGRESADEHQDIPEDWMGRRGGRRRGFR